VVYVYIDPETESINRICSDSSQTLVYRSIKYHQRQTLGKPFSFIPYYDEWFVELMHGITACSIFSSKHTF